MNKRLQINIEIDAKTGKIIATKKEFDYLKNAINKTDDSTKNFQNRLENMAHLGAGVYALKIAFDAVASVTNSFIQTADKMSNVDGRLKLVTSSLKEQKVVYESLVDVASRARVDLAETVELYARIARSVKVLGAETQDTIQVTETISKSLIVSGASAESAKAALIQLGQGFASGVLRGQELMSVMEQTPRLAQAIADGFGVTIGELRKLGEEGKLTAKKVYEALLSQKDAIEKEFAQMPKTVAQANMVLGNSFDDLIKHLNEAGETTNELSKMILELSAYISENRDELVIFASDIARFFSIAGTQLAYAIVGAQELIAEIQLAYYELRRFTGLGDELELTKEIKSLNNEIEILDKQQKLLTKDIEKTSEAYGTLGEKSEESAKKREESIKKATTAQEKATTAQIKSIDELNQKITQNLQKRSDKHKATLNELKAKEKELVDKTIEEQNRLDAALDALNQKKAFRGMDLDEKDRNLSQKDMSGGEVYEDDALRAAQALADAKKALKNEELEEYKKHIALYEELATKHAFTEIQLEEGKKLSKQETLALAKTAIATVKALENEYYETLKNQATQATELKIANIDLEIAAIRRKEQSEIKSLETLKKLIDDFKSREIKLDLNTTDASAAIKELQTTLDILEGKEVEVKANTDEAQKKIDALSEETSSDHLVKLNNKKALEAIKILQKDTSSKHTIYVEKVQKNAMGDFIQKFQNGGMPFKVRHGKLGGYGGGDRIPSLLEDGEFIIRKEAVRKFGSGLFTMLNEMKVPKFQTGGMVGTPTMQNSQNVDIHIHKENGSGVIDLRGSRSMADELGEFLKVNG